MEPTGLDSELESFRQQWRSELKSRKPEPEQSATETHFTNKTNNKASSARRPSRGELASRPIQSQSHAHVVEDDEEHMQAPSFDAPASTSESGQKMIHPENSEKLHLVSALDHYEAAVEREAAGNLGESLKLYRKAFRLDDRVDLAYRKKHFASRWQKAPAATTQEQKPDSSKTPAATDTSNTAHAPQLKPAEDQKLPIGDLINSFSGLGLEPAAAPVEGDPPPPCPIAEAPHEILVHIFEEVAINDVADFVRLSLVCKNFAYLAAKETQIWRRVCTGPEFGFLGMHYHWQRGIEWEPLDEEDEMTEDNNGEYVSMAELRRRRQEESLATSMTLYPEYSSSWLMQWRHRPRIRFNGCYISTVNYLRAGQASVNQVTWASPVHIITYYRYLRFYRDGTVISLLTTHEPGDVVHYMTKDLLKLHDKGEAPHLPSLVMQDALRGRWRLSSALDAPDEETPLKDSEGDVFVETEGSSQKYNFRMELSLRSAGKGARNNKMIWKNFYSYNKLTDDWAEFALKNDKPFFFSRVRSYGVQGE